MPTKFRIARGIDARIQEQSINEGQVYFATDTGKIYYDVNSTDRIIMGASGVAIHYGKAPADLKPDSEYLNGTFFLLSIQDHLVDPSELIAINDLVFNNDGTFYKVQNKDETTLYCQKLAVAGGGSSGGVPTSTIAKITIKTPDNVNLINGQSASIEFIVSSATESDGSPTDDKLTVTWQLAEKRGSQWITYYNGPSFYVNHNEVSTLDFGDYLRPSTTSRLTLYASGINGGEANSKFVEFSTSELTLTKAASFSNLKIFEPDKVIVQCNVTGDMNKILDYYIDGSLIHSKQLRPTDASSQVYTFPTTDKTGKVITGHGAHLIEVKLFQAIVKNGVWTRALSVPPIKMEIAIKEASKTRPIIWLGEYQDIYLNYDDIRIPFLVYDPTATETTTVRLWKDGLPTSSPTREVPSSNYTGFNYFEITDAVLGMKNYYAISCGIGDNEERREIEFEVREDPNRKMVIVKPDYLRFLFEAKGRSNEESVSNRKYWNYENKKQDVNVTAIFNNFNWYNNGWKPDSEGHTCLRISNGAEFILPIGETTLAGGTQTNSSWTYEIQFKVRNIQDYTPLIQNITRYKDDSDYYAAFTDVNQKQYNNYDSFLAYYLPTIGKSYDDLEFDYVYKKINLSKVACGYYSGDQSGVIGFCFGSQDAFFSNGTDTVSVSYVENEMIYLTMVYSDIDKRIYIYINGMLTGAINSTVKNAFKIASEGIKFNSEYCDIDLYQFRIYNTDLNVYDIVMNHAVDTKDINIYDLCGIASANDAIQEYQLKLGSDTENGIIRYNKLYPHKYIMPYIIFDTSNSDDKQLPYSKANDVIGRVTFKNSGLDYAYSSGALEELAIADGLCSVDDSADIKVEAVRQYYLHHCPSFTGDNVTMAVQGTSSEFYPRRNYKLKFKSKKGHFWMNAGPFEDDYLAYGEVLEPEKVIDENTTEKINNPCHTDWFYMNNYDVGTTKFTMKIDFMESSGSYNGGFCRLVHNAYSKHPLDDYIAAKAFKDTDKKLPPTSSLRTNIDGYPVLAFHKKSADNYQYIGRYNMLLDKGSDETYGFKVDKSITANFLEDKRVSDIAECWEFSDNSRTYCSFRDPEGRKELSFLATPRDNNTNDEKAKYRTNTKGSAPIVCDSFEYRYHKYGDVMDYIYDPEKNADKYEKALEAFPKPGEGVENTLDIDNLEDRGKIISNYYQNWEKLCQWVWSTCTDQVPNQGLPVKQTNIGEKAWKPNTFYVYKDGEYVLDSESEFDENTDYYEPGVDDFGKPVHNHVNVNLEAYVPNKYYININGKYVLSADDFDSAQEYYLIEVKEDMLEKEADRLVRQCTAEDTYSAGIDYYTYDPTAQVNKSVTRVTDLTAEQFEANKENYYIGITKQYGNNIHKYDTKEYRNDKFKAELADHFDIEYLSTYFVMTEVFECYDSRGKNCMMASWGPLKKGGEYIWYPIFYDLDTQLGINNTGIPSFTYSVDASEAGNYSTSDSVLWTNFYTNFKSTHILQKYRQLKGESGISSAVGGDNPRKKGLLKDINVIEKWYNADPDECGWQCRVDKNVRAKNYAMTGQRPLIALNLDEYYKFLTIYNERGSSEKVSPDSELYGTTGRINGNGQFVRESTDYLYALQGDRSLSRRQFLSNRITYIDSWLNVGNFARGGAQRLWGRIQANNRNISDHWIEPRDGSYWADSAETIKTHEFDAEYWMTVTPVHDSYVTFGGDNENWPSKKFSGPPLRFNIDSIEAGFRTSDNYKEQLLYVYGIDQMKDLGDLSKMYWTEFKIEGDANKLTRLKLGHDALMTDNDNNLVTENGETVRWYNNKMNPPSFSANGLPLLKEMNFCNITINTANNGSTSLDLSASEKLENFRATGSNLTDVTFAPGVALNTLYLPPTVTRLELVEARLLNKILTSYTIPTKESANGEIVAEPGLFVKGLTDLKGNDTDEVTSIAQLNITGDYFGYDSYKLLTKYYKNRLRNTSAYTKIKLTDVKWSPYIQLIKDDKYNPDRVYKKDNGHYGLEDYEYNIATFDLEVANGEIYVLDESYDSKNDNVITDINMLLDFISEPLLIGPGENSVVPDLSGTIYVNNTDAIDELVIKNQIIKNFPKLNIFCANVNKATSGRFILPDFDDDGKYLGTYSYVSDGETEELSIQKITGDGWFENPYRKYKPEKPNYDFLGWSASLNTKDLISNAKATAEEQNEAWENAKPALLGTDYTFYALFEKHPYEMKFYSGGDTDEHLVDTFSILYGYTLKNSKIIPSYSDDSLELEEVYGFLGWTENSSICVVNDVQEAKLVDFSQLRAVKNYKFYACYKRVSVYDNVANHNLFSYTDFGEGASIGPAPGVRFAGKLTLPARDPKGRLILAVRDFYGQSALTHVFWEHGAQLEVITGIDAYSSAFGKCTSLEYFEFPETVTSIQLYAFYQTALKSLRLPKGLQIIGQNAFNSMIGGMAEITIPGTVTNIGDAAFAYAKPAFSRLIFGGEGDPTRIIDLAANAFVNNRNTGGFTSIIFYYNDPNMEEEIHQRLCTLTRIPNDYNYNCHGTLTQG